LIDGDPDLVQDAINQERDWFASEGQVMFGTGLHLHHSYSVN
jgi:hypothetical protein